MSNVLEAISKLKLKMSIKIPFLI